MNKNEIEKSIQSDKMSALVKARLLFKRELIIDENNNTNVFTDAHFKGLLAQKANVIARRDKLLRTLVYSMFLAYALAEGLGIKVASIEFLKTTNEGFIGLLLCIASVHLFTLVLVMQNEQAYACLIDQVIEKKAGNGSIDPDIVRAAHDEEWLILKLLRSSFNIYHIDSIKTKSTGQLFYNISLFIIFAIWLLFFLLIFGLIVSMTLNYIGGDILGWAIRIFCWFVLTASIFVYAIMVIPFEVADKYSKLPNQNTPK